jgi:hypothetical protein
MKQKSGERTLLASVILSAPRPIVVGIGLCWQVLHAAVGFHTRTAELAAIAVSWAVYGATQKAGQLSAQRKHRLERAANLCVARPCA